MKKFLIFISCTLTIVIISDFVFGVSFTHYVKTHDLPGRFQPLDKLIRHTEYEILLIGNSVIQDGINPSVIEDSTYLSCYNGGSAGQNIDFFETVIDCALQRYTPKMIVLGIRPEETGDNIGEGLFDVLRPYYHIGFKSIDKHFDNLSPDNRILYKSSFYRYNSVWVRILLYSIFKDTETSINGFNANAVPTQIPTIKEVNKVDVPSERKLNCIKRILRKCQERGIKVCICYPPSLLKFPQEELPCVIAVENICRQYNALCLIDYNDPYFLHTPELFYDAGHVNINGAEIYSRKIASRLKKELNNKK